MKKILMLRAELFFSFMPEAKADFFLNFIWPQAYHHPAPRRVIYTSPPPVVYSQQPQVVYQNYGYGYYTQPNYIVYKQHRRPGRGHDHHRGGYGHRYGR